MLPPVQVYVFAPLAVKVTAAPRHAVGELAAMFTVGVLFTIMVIATVGVQPTGLLPVPETLYVVVVAGVTAMVDEVVLPVLHE